MPPVTTGGAVRTDGAAPGVGERLGLGVPDCAHPLLAPREWAALARTGPVGDGCGPPSPLHWTVLNVAGGPGARPDPYCAPAATALRGAGVTLLGRLDMRDGARTFGELVGEARRYLDWYRVDGFYLANCPSGPGSLPHAHRVTATLHALTGGGHLVLAHTRHPHPGFAECPAQLVTFAGSWTDYRWSQAEPWTADLPAGRFCHQVHALPRTHLEEALRIARWQGAGTVCFTDRRESPGQDPWETLPGYWDEIVSRLGPGVSE